MKNKKHNNHIHYYIFQNGSLTLRCATCRISRVLEDNYIPLSIVETLIEHFLMVQISPHHSIRSSEFHVYRPEGISSRDTLEDILWIRCGERKI